MMKLFTAIITIVILGHGVFAGPRWTKEDLEFNDVEETLKNPDFEEFKESIKSPDVTREVDVSKRGNLTVITTHINNGTNCRPLNDNQVKEKITNLGILQNTAVKLVNVSGDLLSALQSNGTVTLPLQNRKKRSNSQFICQEEAIAQYILANQAGSLAYQITAVRCAPGEGGSPMQECKTQISSLSVSIGDCIQRVATIVLHVVSGCGDNFIKTVLIQCACLCKKH